MKTIFNLTAAFLLIVSSSCKKKETQKEEPINYTNVKITNVKLINMSFLDASSAGWDVSSGPDVFFKILNPSSTVATGATSWDITTGSLPISWNLSSPLQIANLSTQFTFELWDNDSDAVNPDDYIHGYYFTPDIYKSGYPSIITLQSGTNPLKVELSVVWY